MHTSPKSTDANIKMISGKSVVAVFKIIPATAESAAPPPIIIALPRPDAVPARRGKIDNIPAVAFGMVIPLPSPTKDIKPKKVSALACQAHDRAAGIDNPIIDTIRPNTTMRSLPTLTD